MFLSVQVLQSLQKAAVSVLMRITNSERLFRELADENERNSPYVSAYDGVKLLMVQTFIVARNDVVLPRRTIPLPKKIKNGDRWNSRLPGDPR